MAKLSPKMWYLLKYGFLILIAAGILVIILPVLTADSDHDELQLLNLSDNFSDPSFNENFGDPAFVETFSLGILRENITGCFMKSTQLELFDLNNEKDSSVKDPELELFTLLSNFTVVLKSLNIKAAIIEPSILYCTLSPQHQDLMVKRKFNVSSYLGSKETVTLGILAQDASILQQVESIGKLQDSGFQAQLIKVPLASWMLNTNRSGAYISHILYTHKNFNLHLVVFQNRAGYLWHAALDGEAKKQFSTGKKLLFVDYNGAYEKFTLIPLKRKAGAFADFYIPSYPHHFMFQMLSSRFLECNPSRSANLTSTKDQPKAHPGLTVDRFNKRAKIALNQLKAIFQPFLMNLWIFSGTMLGWYRQCDVIPYTTDVDFGAWATEVKDLDIIIHLLRNNKHLTLKMRMGVLNEALEFQLDCYGMRTDVFFLYQVTNGSWCSGHSPHEGNYFRYYYPHFSLCSAELLGEKVQVPCETEKLILGEYGPEWSKPESSWDYKASIKNRGPYVYWDKEKLKSAYQVY